MVCSEPAADESLAAIRARIRFGIAIAAIIRMIATTINNSIREKPLSFRIFICPRVPSFCHSRWPARFQEPHVKVLHSDSQRGPFNVRLKQSGEPLIIENGAENWRLTV